MTPVVVDVYIQPWGVPRPTEAGESPSVRVVPRRLMAPGRHLRLAATLPRAAPIWDGRMEAETLGDVMRAAIEAGGRT